MGVPAEHRAMMAGIPVHYLRRQFVRLNAKLPTSLGKSWVPGNIKKYTIMAVGRLMLAHTKILSFFIYFLKALKYYLLMGETVVCRKL